MNKTERVIAAMSFLSQFPASIPEQYFPFCALPGLSSHPHLPADALKNLIAYPGSVWNFLNSSSSGSMSRCVVKSRLYKFTEHRESAFLLTGCNTFFKV